MCTVTWCSEDSGYVLLFNRDEARTRGPAFPPEVRMRNGVRFISPMDSDAGGTWLGVNEYGVTVGLLNFCSTEYTADTQALPPGGIKVSRGILVNSLLDSPDIETVDARLRETDRTRYMPFLLFAMESAERRAYWNWTGRAFERTDEPDLPLSTSGFSPEDVLRFRSQVLRRIIDQHGGLSSETLFAFHCYHDPEYPTHSVSMEREEARTVSFTEIRVRRDHVSLAYTAGFPATGAAFPALSVKRRVAATQ
ncbi:MAG: NRDE family protein [bacterium]